MITKHLQGLSCEMRAILMGNAAVQLDQLGLFEDPQDHYNILHNKKLANKRPGTIIAWTPKNEKKKWHSLTEENASAVIPLFVDELDVYITPNEFYGWRKISNLHSLQAFYIDIDCHEIDYSNDDDVLRIPTLVATTLDNLERAGIPDPNCIVYSGRGIHLYWLLEPTHPNALPRWQACQRRLVDVCNADRQSADATRVLRLVGSINSKTNAKVRAEQRHNQVFKFDWLHDQIMPLARQELAEIRDIRALRASKGLKPVKAQHSPIGSIYARWHLVYQDLLMIIDVQVKLNANGNGLPTGMRNLLIFHLANALSWFTLSDALDNEVIDCARKFTPTLGLNEALSYCSSVISRARKTQLEGHEHRYRYKRETLYRQLKDLIPEDLQPQLRAIIPDELAKERHRVRMQESRRSVGVVSRNQYDESRANEVNLKAQKAHALKAEGKSVRAIAKELEVSVGTVSNYLKKECSTVCALV